MDAIGTDDGWWWILGWQLHVIRQRARLREWLDFRESFVMTDLGEFWLNRPDISGWGEIPWYRRLLGDEPVVWIVLARDVPDESKTNVERAFPEALVEQEPLHAQDRTSMPAWSCQLEDPFPELGESAIDDTQYAANKARQRLDHEFDATFDQLSTRKTRFRRQNNWPSLRCWPIICDAMPKRRSRRKC